MADLRSRFLQRNILIEIFEDREGRQLIRLPLRTRPENARFARTLARIMAEERMALTARGSRRFDFLRVNKYNGPDGEMTERPKVLAC